MRRATEQVMTEAAAAGIWVVLGSAHPLGDGLKPHNSRYVIDDAERLRERYDKRFCSGDPDETIGDLAHYTPGDHASVWQVRDLTRAALICYDCRFPELDRDLLRRGAQLVLHSFHTAGLPAGRVAAIAEQIGPGDAELNRAETLSYPAVTLPAAMTTAAACNHLWISAANSSAAHSLWPAMFVRADGITTGRLPRESPGVLISEVDTTERLYDATAHWRGRALAGVWHSGTTTRHPRSRDRTRL
ncbi:carbon-nitrogen hydrolase family protein [Saccharopolyspora halophila]|uniref:Carbon-nitrogen hydrolase family protein n=1 Tax=Saccharopolyspora halophila TaxID=405551 RepID=A0ABP5THF4_9PSEU